MTADFLQIWSSYGLDPSILTALLLGILVLLGLKETLGWGFVGPVVPGYLAMALLIEPAAGIVIAIEAVLTVAIARFLACGLPERIAAWWPWFARERLVSLVLVSIIVRHSSQGWLPAAVTSWLDSLVALYQSAQFYVTQPLAGPVAPSLAESMAQPATPSIAASLGLVLVPLTANRLWNLNLRRGAYQLVVPTLITYVLMQYLLVAYANVPLRQVEAFYHDHTMAFLGSTRAQLVLLAGAVAAARWQSRIGTGGVYSVMVPALLGLAWLSPVRIAVTLAQAVVLYLGMRLILALITLCGRSLHDHRITALVFALGFVLEYAFAGEPLVSSGVVDALEHHGYGYLLTVLLARNMLHRGAIARVAVPAVLISSLAFVIGSCLSFVIEQAAPAVHRAGDPLLLPQAPSIALAHDPLGTMVLARVRARSALPDSFTRNEHQSTELAAYVLLWRDIETWLHRGLDPADASRLSRDVRPSSRPLPITSDRPGAAHPGRPHPEAVQPGPVRRGHDAIPRAAPPALPAAIRRRAVQLGMHLAPVPRALANGRQAWLLTEATNRPGDWRGWDTALLVPGASGPMIEVPRPRAEAPAAEMAAVLCARIDCRAVLVSGVDTAATSAAPIRDRLAEPSAHQHLGATAALQLRIDSRVDSGIPQLHLRQTLPGDFDLAHLWPGEIDINWRQPPAALRRWPGPKAFAVLRVHPRDAYAVVLDEAKEAPRTYAGTTLASYLDRRHRPVAGAHTDHRSAAVLAPTAADLRVLDRLVAVPLLDLVAGDSALPPAASGEANAQPGAEARVKTGAEAGNEAAAAATAYIGSRPEQLRWLQRLAALIDYQLVFLPACDRSSAGRTSGCWLLEPAHSWWHRSGAALVVRAGGSAAMAVEVPYPGREVGALPAAAALWRQTHSRALVVATGSADHNTAAPGMLATPLQALHRAVHYHLHGQPQALALQIRGLPGDRGHNSDVVVDLGLPRWHDSQVPPALAALSADRGALNRLAGAGPQDHPSSRIRQAGPGKPKSPIRWYDGSLDLAQLSGYNSQQLTFSRTRGGLDMAILWLSAELRHRYTGPARADFQMQLAQLGLTVTDADIAAALLATPPPGQASRAREDRDSGAEDELALVLDRVRDYATTGNHHLLAALKAHVQQSSRAAVQGFFSPRLALPFIVVEVRDRERLWRAAVLISAAGATACPPVVAPTSRRGDAQVAADLRQQLQQRIRQRCRVIALHRVAPGQSDSQ